MGFRTGAISAVLDEREHHHENHARPPHCADDGTRQTTLATFSLAVASGSRSFSVETVWWAESMARAVALTLVQAARVGRGKARQRGAADGPWYEFWVLEKNPPDQAGHSGSRG